MKTPFACIVNVSHDDAKRESGRKEEAKKQYLYFIFNDSPLSATYNYVILSFSILHKSSYLLTNLYELFANANQHYVTLRK